MRVPEGCKVLTHDCYLVFKIQCVLEKAWVASSTDQMQLHCVAVQDRSSVAWGPDGSECWGLDAFLFSSSSLF